ncbi:unnamed protein product [Microthlaspi erraticum]|uniref:TF-B3 domain-containing protein n=1 Tax=Microthlaspi erraticum TaxID=1685480 RepID=A0A6D2J6S1_9BRAS|nr:unnamed protein product [Microthlaspi erraticum]
MANQHFFKPLLPGFHSHLTIPIAFLKHMDRKYEQDTAELRSDASIKIWKVKLEAGRRLTDGWKEFALSHDLRIGDIVVFRLEKDMAFHVTLFGTSCCEIQYGSFLDNQNNLGKIQRKKKVKKDQRRETESSSLEPSCFVANVSPASLRCDTLCLPRRFVRENGLDTRCGEIVLMKEKCRSWRLNLKRKNSCGTMYITRGWRSFCGANGIRAGGFFTFKLIQRGKTLILRLSPEGSNNEEDCSSEANEVESLSTEQDSNRDERSSQEGSKRKEKKGISICKASSSASQNRFVTVTLTPYNIRLSKLVLPIPFTKVNGIKRAKKMSLLDKHGVKWSTKLWFEKERKRMRLVGGWREFCDANGVKIGESIILELIWDANRSSVLKFCSKVTK